MKHPYLATISKKLRKKTSRTIKRKNMMNTLFDKYFIDMKNIKK